MKWNKNYTELQKRVFRDLRNRRDRLAESMQGTVYDKNKYRAPKPVQEKLDTTDAMNVLTNAIARSKKDGK